MKVMTAFKRSGILALALLLALAFSTPAYANPALIMRGVGRTIFSVLQLPAEMLANSGRAFPLGMVAGAVSGTMKAVAGTVIGAADIARGGAPYAKYAVFL
jgi:hypothetical protein